MGLLKRLLRVVRAEAHSVIEKLEDPIKITEEGIRELKKQLKETMEALAQVKASLIRFEREARNERERARALTRKAEEVLLKAKNGEIPLEEAEREAASLLEKVSLHEKNAQRLEEEAQRQRKMAQQLQAKVEELKVQIAKYEAELKTLKARLATAKAVKKVNKQLTKVDPSDTIAMLERMKEKVEEEEALAQAYEELAGEEKTPPVTSGEGKEKLEELKKRLGLS
ncbi:MAG: PspA/IM30 family protein [Aquificae bacterium]|nr:PspA/IM30 family protein [Aquificota bacterium]